MVRVKDEAEAKEREVEEVLAEIRARMEAVQLERERAEYRQRDRVKAKNRENYKRTRKSI